MKVYSARRLHLLKFASECQLNGEILEVGAGRDNRLFEHSHAVDIDPSAHPDEVIDASKLQDVDKYDAVVCLEVIEHSPNPRAVTRGLFRCVKPRGTVVLSAPFMLETHAEEDYWRFNHKGMVDLIESSGLKIVEYKALGGYWTLVSDLLFSRIPLLGYISSRVAFWVERPSAGENPRCTSGYVYQCVKGQGVIG